MTEAAIDRVIIAQAMRGFATEPAYQAYRILVDRDWFLLDPVVLANQIEAGLDWAGVVAIMMDGPRASHVGARVATRLAAITDHEALFALLERVEARRNADDGGWGHDVFAEWIALAPDWFEPVLFGALWRRVPPRCRPMLIHGARVTFGARLGSAATSGAKLGAAGELSHLLQHPEEVEPRLAVELVRVLWSVLPEATRGESLLAIGRHPHPDVQWAVVDLLGDWISYMEPAPKAAEITDVGRMFLASEAGSAHAPLASKLLRDLVHASDNRAGLISAFFGLLVEDFLSLAASIEVDDHTASRFLERVWPQHSEAWARSLASARTGARHVC